MTDPCKVWKPNLFILCLDNSESNSHSTATYDVGSTLQPRSSLCPFLLPVPLCQMMLIPGALWNSHLLHTPLCLRVGFPGHSTYDSLCQDWAEKADTKMGILELDPQTSSWQWRHNTARRHLGHLVIPQNNPPGHCMDGIVFIRAGEQGVASIPEALVRYVCSKTWVIYPPKVQEYASMSFRS